MSKVMQSYWTFPKAFDKAPHHLLIHKLQHYGIDRSALGWITAFLTDRTQEVHVQGSTSNTSPVTSGVPQGSVLGPLLSLMFINNMPSYIKNSSTVRLFADNADCLLQWESDLGMTFRRQKCQTIRVTERKSRQ